MKAIIGERGCGKTSKLFKYAKDTDSIILTINPYALKEKAKSMKYKGLEIIGFNDLDNDNFSFGKNIVVDNAEYVLQSLLNEYYGLNMTGFTATME